MLLIHALAGQKETVTGQASVTFHCPVCRARDVEAVATDTEYTIKLLHVIPVGRSRLTAVKCPRCHVSLVSSIPAAELSRRHASETVGFLRARISPVAYMLLVIGFLTMIFPPFGMIFPGIALALTWRSGGAPKKWAISELAVSALVGMVLLVALLFPDPGH